MKLKAISKEEFNEIEGVRQVIVHDHPWRFSILYLDETLGCYGLSWRSELIEPVIKPSPDGAILWIGVDQQVTAICLRTGRICLTLPLIYSFFDFAFWCSTTVVLTELEVLLFNSNLSIRASYGLPEIADEMLTVGERLVIYSIDRESLTTIDLQTGALINSK